MLTGVLLGLIEQLGLDILILTEAINEAEFFASRLTRTETLRLLESMVKAVDSLPAGVRKRMPEIDWGAWTALTIALLNHSHHRLQIWVAVKELTPLTLQHLNGYKRIQPQLFAMVP